MIKLTTFCLALVFLFSCSFHKEEKKNEAAVKNDTLVFNNNEVLFNGDSVEVAPFEIEVSLDPKAEEKLKTSKETIIVAAYYSGTPKDTTLKEYLKSGEFAIGSREKELTNERVAKFEGVRFSRSLYDSITAKSLSVLINVYSGRRSTGINLLDCDILQDSISKIKGKKFVLKGKLIRE